MKSFLRRFGQGCAALALCTSAACVANTEPATPVASTPAAVHTEAQGPALWKVADEDTTIYLFGTVHALPQDVEWFRGPIATALGASDTLVTEITKDSMSDPATQQTTIKMALLPPDQSLRAMLDADQRARYEAQMTKLGLPVEAFDRFDPWFAGVTMAVAPLLKGGYSPDSGAEQVIDSKAGPDKTRGQLETVEYQLGLFDSMTQEQQVDFLMSTVDGADTLIEVMNRMVAEWAEGDADQLAVIMNEQLTDANLADTLLYSRNRKWAQWIDDRMDQPGTVFIAVGAGHLAGANSVQDYLAQRDIVSTRVQ